MRYFDKKPVLIYKKEPQKEEAPVLHPGDYRPERDGGAKYENLPATPDTKAEVQNYQAQPQADTFGDYQRQTQQQYATTLADIRRRRQELESKYQPSIERQRKVMKIIALGKLIGQLGQLGGAAVAGSAGTPVVDKDPYQVNAWKELSRLQQEQRYYGQQLDAEERAAQKNMQTGLNRLAVEEMRAKRNADAIIQRYNMQMKLKEFDYKQKAALKKAEEEFKFDYLHAKGEEDRRTAEYRFKLECEKIAAQGVKEKDVATHKSGLKQDEDEAKAQRKASEKKVTVTTDKDGNKKTTVTGTTYSGNGKKNVWGGGKKNVW